MGPRVSLNKYIYFYSEALAMGSRSTPVPVYGKRALKIGSALIVADLHIGIESELRGRGAYVPSQARVIEKDLVSLIEGTETDELIILGDVKHNIPSTSLQEHREIPRLIREIGKYVDVTLIKGNHDGGLENFPIGLPILDYLEVEGVLLAHGHSWIKSESIDAEIVVLAHSHPAVAFVDEFGRATKEPAWIRGRFNENVRGRYNVKGVPEFIVMPAFNPLISGAAFNRVSEMRLLGPYFKSGIIDLDGAHAYLLDGTDLGQVSGLYASEKESQ
jgi:putative SbcD/Mre11-related phosphoesterase